ncbi:PHLP3 [Enterospora canceri]|uniref:PHLP3 n=1 Tax=Enterospora canceri TaxID=1081671 RepID=A0A1Y1S8M8_9MICR|nr:PHLP3 [Enterospora canceri]
MEGESDEFIDEYAREKYEERNRLVAEYETEDQLMAECEKSGSNILVHFYSNDFSKCRELNNLLIQVAQNGKYEGIGFRKIDASKCKTLAVKLGIRRLPLVCVFKNGYFIDSFVGYEGFGGRSSAEVEDVEEYLDKSELMVDWKE